ncbi:MAG: 50S ribosomal protein L31 [Deltaproteobacteria bacterium]|nr:50S ribosomal protein L31 [Deltaproteobacteria bacterium]
MKEGIHPTLNEVVITCACGNQIKTLSTGPKAYAIEICSNCHPFFTGKHKLVDSAGRVERFQKKYANFKKKPRH